jgi:hypothetical protein
VVIAADQLPHQGGASPLYVSNSLKQACPCAADQSSFCNPRQAQHSKGLHVQQERAHACSLKSDSCLMGAGRDSRPLPTTGWRSRTSALARAGAPQAAMARATWGRSMPSAPPACGAPCSASSPRSSSPACPSPHGALEVKAPPLCLCRGPGALLMLLARGRMHAHNHCGMLGSISGVIQVKTALHGVSAFGCAGT